MKALLTRKFCGFGFFFIGRHPLNEKCRVVVGKKVVVEVLLDEISCDEVFESHERKVLFIGNYHSGDLTKNRKDLNNHIKTREDLHVLDPLSQIGSSSS